MGMKFSQNPLSRLLTGFSASAGDIASTDSIIGAFNKIAASVQGFTAGSVLFANSLGRVSQDNTYFYWDETNKRLHLGGNSAPPSKLTITGTTANDSATLGAEFLTGTGWTSTGWTGSWVGGWTHTAGNTSVLSYPTAAVNATRYQIAYIVTGRTVGSFTLAFGGQSNAGITTTGAFGPTTTSTAGLTITPTTDFDGTITISIKAITAVITPQITIKDAAGNVVGETVANANYNYGNGVGALAYITAGANNTAYGYQSLRSNTTGINNTSNGYQALYANTVGSYNTTQGYQALLSNTSGGSNTACGMFAMYMNTNGSNNTSVGLQSLYSNSSGSNNIAIGHRSGRYMADGATANTSSTSCVFVGMDAKSFTASDSNQIVIGYSATGLGSNTAVIGSTTILRSRLQGAMSNGGFGGTTTDATPAELFLGGVASQRLALANNSAFAFRIMVMAGVTGAGNSSAWSIEGVIKRGANAASTTLVGTATPVLIQQDAGASTWAVAATADTTNGGLAFTVTGQAATTIQWRATVTISEISF